MRTYDGGTTPTLKLDRKTRIALVAQANAGLKALGQLYEAGFKGIGTTPTVLASKTKIEALAKGIGAIASGWTSGTWELQVSKEPPDFKSFVVGSQSWEVRMDGLELHVGCRHILYPVSFYRSLRDLAQGGPDSQVVQTSEGDVKLRPGRTGVYAENFTHGFVLWEDVQRMLTVLKPLFEDDGL